MYLTAIYDMYKIISHCLQPKKEIEHVYKEELQERNYGIQSLKITSLWTNNMVKLF